MRSRHDLTLVTDAGDEPGELDAVEALQSSGLEVVAVDGRQPADVRARWQRRWRLASTWAWAGPWRTVWFAHPDVQGELDRLTRSRQFDVVDVEDNSMGVFRLPATLPRVLTEHEVCRPRPLSWQCGRPREWATVAAIASSTGGDGPSTSGVWRRFDLVRAFSRLTRTPSCGWRPTSPAGSRDAVRHRVAGARRSGHERPATVLFTGNFAHPPNVAAARWLLAEILPRLRTTSAGARLRLVGATPPGDRPSGRGAYRRRQPASHARRARCRLRRGALQRRGLMDDGSRRCTTRHSPGGGLSSRFRLSVRAARVRH